MYHVYLLHCDKKTYIGMTDNPLHRLRQHNREIAGGARATAGHIWKHVCVLSGFPTRRSALQFEWMWKYSARRTHARSIEAKMETLSQIWKCDCSSSKSIHFSQLSTPFFLSFSLPLTEKLNKIESIQSLKLSGCGKQFQISDYVSFQLFPFPLISKMSSISNAISVAVEAAPAVVEAAPPVGAVGAVVAVVVEEKKKTQRKPKTAPVAVTEPAAESAAAEPKTEKKPKTKKEKDSEAPVADSEAPVEKKARKPKTAASAAAPAPAPKEAPKEEKPKKTKKAAAAAEPAAAEPVDAMAALRALLDMPVSTAGAAPLTDAETTTDAEAAPKEKKPRKPRAKKTAAPAAAALQELDTATLDSLDMAGKVSLLKDHVLTLTQQVAALTARLGSGGAPASSDDESTGKKQRKKREPKEKAVCPAAAEGVIRFHTTLKNDYKPLSNSFKKDVTIDGVVYPSVEHYYHCAKFLSTDAEYAEKIRTTANPALVKNMGRSKKVETRADWEAVHLDVMRKALQAKFSQHTDLATLLRNTGAARLEEQSPSDAFWGIGADGAGTNQLGLLLAEIRATL
jgi:ribA/ribD-fused uncharacterized protein